MAANRAMIGLIWDIRLSLVVAMVLIAISIANSKFGWEPRPSATVSIAYLVLRVLLAVFAGYLATYRTLMGLWGAAIAGLFVFISEQVIIVAWFASIGDWADVGRVAQGFVMVFWVPMIIGTIGGLIGRSRRLRETPAI